MATWVDIIGFVMELAVKSSFLLLAVFVLAQMMVKRSAAQRGLIWPCAMIALLLLPVAMLLLPELKVTWLLSWQQQFNQWSTENAESFWLQAGFAVYVFGLLSRLISVAGAFISLPFKAASLDKLPKDWLQQVQTWRFLLGVSRPVQVRISANSSGPYTWGLFRPVVVFPTSALNWPQQDFVRALIHELSHVRRWDWPLQLSRELVLCFYWCHPLVWWLAKHNALDAERCCDDAVLEQTEDAFDYADQLIALASSKNCPLSTLAMAEKKELRSRISALIDASQARHPADTSVAAYVFLLSIFAVLPYSSLQGAAASPKLYPDHWQHQTSWTRVRLQQQTSPKLMPQFPENILPRMVLASPQPQALARVTVEDSPQTIVSKPDTNLTAKLKPDLSLDMPAVLTEQVTPKYPKLALRERVQGFVLLEYDINAAGEVINGRVVDAQPAGYFESSALQAQQAFKYIPRLKGGVASATSKARNRFVYVLDG